MRYAIVSDIHANWQAWNAVLLDIRTLRADQIICLGDIIGYGPNPAEVMQSVYENVNHLVLGNHDAALCGKIETSLFTDRAAEMIEWTKLRLSRDAITFLSGLPLTLKGDGFRCVHGDYSEPESFHYVIAPEDARASWESVTDSLLFIGHSHQPSIFLLGESGIPRMVAPQDFVLEEQKRYIVNAGSVGEPRDGLIRASYCIYDEALSSVFWRSVPFDIDAYKQAMTSAGLSPEISQFLDCDPRKGTPPLRTLLTFTPPSDPAQGVRNTVPVMEIQRLHRQTQKWRIFAVSAIFIVILLAVLSSVLARQADNKRGKTISDPATTAIHAAIPPAGQNLLSSFPKTVSQPGTPVPGWEIRLADEKKQFISVEIVEGNPQFVMTSMEAETPVSLYSQPVKVIPGMKITLECMLKKDPSFRGVISANLVLERQIGGRLERMDPFLVKQPNIYRRDGWVQAKQTFTVPQDATILQLAVSGQFTGKVFIREIALRRK